MTNEQQNRLINKVCIKGWREAKSCEFDCRVRKHKTSEHLELCLVLEQIFQVNFETLVTKFLVKVLLYKVLIDYKLFQNVETLLNWNF